MMIESPTGIIETTCPSSRWLISLTFLGIVSWPLDFISDIKDLTPCNFPPYLLVFMKSEYQNSEKKATHHWFDQPH
jgi:hypothetical protein